MKKNSALENLLGRLDDLDNVSLANLVQRLARERDLLETVFTVVREGILVIERNGMVVYLNQAASTHLGIPLREAGKANLWQRVPDLARTLSLGRDGSLPAPLGITRELEVSYPEPRVLQVYLAPLMVDRRRSGSLPADPPDHFVVILSDVTRQQAMTRQEIETEKVNSVLHLAAGVAHELGNPLNSLTIHLQLMQRQLRQKPAAAQPDRLAQTVGICLEEVRRLDGIITHFLEAVRPHPPDLADTDLVSVLEETLDFLGPELGDAELSADIALDGPIPIVMADRNQIKQVFFNLLKNAAEAMTRGGRIQVTARSDDDFVYILVGDTGSGMSEETLNRVFQPYYSTKKGGSGLGLMIVQRIVRDHGGHIGIDTREGRGTVVTVQLPQKHRRVRLLGSGTASGAADAGSPE